MASREIQSCLTPYPLPLDKCVSHIQPICSEYRHAPYIISSLTCKYVLYTITTNCSAGLVRDGFEHLFMCPLSLTTQIIPNNHMQIVPSSELQPPSDSHLQDDQSACPLVPTFNSVPIAMPETPVLTNGELLRLRCLIEGESVVLCPAASTLED